VWASGRSRPCTYLFVLGLEVRCSVSVLNALHLIVTAWGFRRVGSHDVPLRWVGQGRERCQKGAAAKVLERRSSCLGRSSTALVSFSSRSVRVLSTTQ
jgi:hypothetical protein